MTQAEKIRLKLRELEEAIDSHENANGSFDFDAVELIILLNTALSVVKDASPAD